MVVYTIEVNLISAGYLYLAHVNMYHIEAYTKWQPFWRRHFQMHVVVRNVLYLINVALKFNANGPMDPALVQILNSPLQWRHTEHDGVSNHQPHNCLLNRLFRHRSKKTSKLRVTGLCAGNSPVTGEIPAKRASNAENVSIWWRHHAQTSPQAIISFNYGLGYRPIYLSLHLDGLCQSGVHRVAMHW